MTLALLSIALASVLAAGSIAASADAASGVALGGALGVLLLVAALVTGTRGLVAPAVGIVALAALGANRSSYALAPVEAMCLVAIALFAWWSIDERHQVAREPGVDRARAMTSAALVLSAAGLSALVVAMASVASSKLVAPSVGAVGIVSIAAGLWSVARIRKYEAERGR